MSEPQGFSFPQSPTGRGSVIPNPPWYFSGTWMTVEYRTNPDNVRALLPEPLELDEDDPGRVAFVWADWQSSSEGGEELLDPVRSQYSEAFLAIKTRFQGKLYTRIAYIWVDRDFSLVRGLHMGYPKKFGSIHQTRPFPFGKTPRVEPGGTFGASLAVHDRRLANGRVTLREQTTTDLPTVNGNLLLHSRFVRSIEKGGGYSLNELVAHTPVVDGGVTWTADADIELFTSPTDELHLVSVDEVVAGYYQQVSAYWDGGEMVYDYLADGS